MARILLFDNQRDLSFLYSHFDRVIHSPLSKHKPVAWLKGAWEALCTSRKDDKIVCWYDFQAILLFYLCRITFRRRKIICLNILLKNKETTLNRFVQILYRHALRSSRFSATVTSTLYGHQVNEWLGTDCTFTLLRDLFFESYRLPDLERIERADNTVFCGGSNGRDWPLMINIAKAMPSVRFRLVVTESILQGLKVSIPENVTIVHDIPLNDFVREMSQASVICNPLDTDAPAGLIVIFRAAANDKPIIATDTIVTREYITTGETGILVRNNVDAWVEAIQFMLNNQTKAGQMAKSLHASLSATCNETIFASTVINLSHQQS